MTDAGCAATASGGRDTIVLAMAAVVTRHTPGPSVSIDAPAASDRSTGSPVAASAAAFARVSIWASTDSRAFSRSEPVARDTGALLRALAAMVSSILIAAPVPVRRWLVLRFDPHGNGPDCQIEGGLARSVDNGSPGPGPEPGGPGRAGR